MAVIGNTRLLLGQSSTRSNNAVLGHPWLYQDMQGCTMTYVAVLGQTRLQDLHGCTRTYVVVLGHTQAVTKTYKVTSFVKQILISIFIFQAIFKVLYICEVFIFHVFLFFVFILFFGVVLIFRVVFTFWVIFVFEMIFTFGLSFEIVLLHRTENHCTQQQFARRLMVLSEVVQLHCTMSGDITKLWWQHTHTD